jgi:predicted dehydrogenase
LTALCDISEDRIPDDSDVPYFNNIEDFLEVPNLSTVIVSVPNKEHYSVACKVIKSGKNLIIEKPATESVQEFKELMELSKTNNTLLYSAYHAAFGKEVLWLKSNYDTIISQYGAVSSFDCLFSDPYIKNNELLPEAKSLGGSWVDSGINALSILDCIFDEISMLNLYQIDLFGCEDVQSAGYLHFKSHGCEGSEVSYGSEGSEGSEGCLGNGIINTNWTLNKNFKCTTIYFADSDVSLILNHSDQKVSVIKDNKEEVLYESSSSIDRLTAHYYGVFNDYSFQLTHNKDNTAESLRLLEMLYEYYFMK